MIFELYMLINMYIYIYIGGGGNVEETRVGREWSGTNV